MELRAKPQGVIIMVGGGLGGKEKDVQAEGIALNKKAETYHVLSVLGMMSNWLEL